jgi:hypothetical protein
LIRRAGRETREERVEGNRRDSFDEREKQTLDNLEISDSRADTWRSWLWTAAAALVVVFLISLTYAVWFVAIPALEAGKNASIATSQGWGQLITSDDSPIRQGLVKFNNILGHGEKVMENAAAVTEQSNRLMTGLADETPTVLRKVGNMTEAGSRAFTATADEVRVQIKNIGGETTGLISDMRLVTVKELKQVLVEAAMFSQNMNVVVGSEDFKALPGEVKTLITSLNKTAKGFEPIPDDLHNIGQELTGVSVDLHSMTTDVANKVHSITNPPKPKGFKQKLVYYLVRVADGIRTGGSAAWVVLKVRNGL